MQRGIQLLGNRKQVLVQDEIVHPTPTTCWWFAHFNASVATAISGDGSSVTLQNGAERLWGRIVSGGGVWTVREALPLPTSPAPAENANNTGYKKLAIQLTGVTNTTLAVWFVPLAPGENPPTNTLTLTPLNTWSLIAQNDPPVARNGVATSTNNAPVDVDLLGLASDDWTYPNNLIFAVTNAQDGSAVLLPDGHTARFTPAGGNPGFDYLVTDEDGQTSSAIIIIGVQPATYVWTNLASGSWSTGANWSNGVAPVSSRGNRLEFFSGRTFAGGPFALNNNLPGTTLVNALVLGGIASGTATVNLTGGALQLAANGLTAPTITLDAYSTPFTYNISNAITLDDGHDHRRRPHGHFQFRRQPDRRGRRDAHRQLRHADIFRQQFLRRANGHQRGHVTDRQQRRDRHAGRRRRVEQRHAPLRARRHVCRGERHQRHRRRHGRGPDDERCCFAHGQQHVHRRR